MSGARPPSALGVVVALIRLALGALFAFAAINKISDIQGFAFSVKAFDLLPPFADHIAKLIAFSLPWTELFIGILLILGLWTRATTVLLALILMGFIAGIVSVLSRHLNVSCGCFGRFEIPCTGPVSSCHVIRNCVLLACSLFVLWKGPGSLALDKHVKG